MNEDIASTAELLATMRDTSQRTHQLTKAIDRVIATNRLNPDFDWLLSRLQNLVVASHSSSSGSAGVDPDSPMKRTSVNITEYASKVGLFSSGHLSDSYSAHAQFTKPLYRKAASRFHPDHSKDPEAQEKFQLAKMLSDANDAEGLALLLFQDGIYHKKPPSIFKSYRVIVRLSVTVNGTNRCSATTPTVAGIIAWLQDTATRNYRSVNSGRCCFSCTLLAQAPT